MIEKLGADKPGEGSFDNDDNTMSWGDLSKVENPKFNPATEKENSQYSPEEYNKLAKKELLLRGNVFDSMTFRANSVRSSIYEIEDIVQRDPRFSSHQLINSLESISDREKSTSRDETDSLVYYVDALYPSQFGNKISDNPDANAREADYFGCAGRKDMAIVEGVDDVKLALRDNEKLAGTHIAGDIAKLSERLDGGNREIAKAMIEYLHKPSEDTRHNLSKTIDGYTGSIGGGVKDLGFGLSGVSNQASDSVDRLGAKTRSGIEQYYSAVMNYIDFKLQHAPEKTTDDSSSNLANLFK